MKKSNCTPWDYPLPKGEQISPLCTSYYDGKVHFNSLHNFKIALNDPLIMSECKKACLPNCEEITYSYEIDTTYLEVDQLCQEGEESRKVSIYLSDSLVSFN